MSTTPSGSVLALIPARGGSKSIPRKNLKTLGGHPLLAYSIACAQATACKPRVVVSTDDEEIASVAQSYGAEVPFLRPVALAQDDTTDLPVFEHALQWFARNENWQPEVVAQLRPTSPFRPMGLLDRAVALLQNTPAASSVRSVVEPGQNPYKMWRKGQDGFIFPLMNLETQEFFNLPRQRLPPTLWHIGLLDLIRTKTILHDGLMTGPRVLPLEVDAKYCVDIDTEADWLYAEWLLQNKHLEIVVPKKL